jgi:hypothetical protein
MGVPAAAERSSIYRILVRFDLVASGPLRVQRRVSSREVTEVTGQRMRIGYAHRHTLIDIDVHKGELRVYDRSGERLALIPEPAAKRSARSKGYDARDRAGQPASSVHAGADVVLGVAGQNWL